MFLDIFRVMFFSRFFLMFTFHFSMQIPPPPRPPGTGGRVFVGVRGSHPREAPGALEREERGRRQRLIPVSKQ